MGDKLSQLYDAFELALSELAEYRANDYRRALVTDPKITQAIYQTLYPKCEDVKHHTLARTYHYYLDFNREPLNQYVEKVVRAAQVYDIALRYSPERAMLYKLSGYRQEWHPDHNPPEEEASNETPIH